MPKTQMTYLQEKRQRTKACIANYEQLCMTNNEKMAKVLGIHINTLKRKRENPEQFTLEELWKLANYLKCPLGELAGGERAEELIGKWISTAKAM